MPNLRTRSKQELAHRERLIAVVTAVSIIVFTMFLVARNEPFASPDLARMMRILLSLGIGVLGATIPGFLNVAYNGPGFAVRAGGAMALFIVTFWGSPKVDALGLGEPVVELAPISQIDIRTRAAPDVSEAGRLNASAVVTIPISLRNLTPAGKSAFVEQVLTSVPIGDGGTQFGWKYFVNMHEEARGLWLAIVDDAQPRPILPGSTFNAEVLQFPDGDLSWSDVLRFFEESLMDVGIAKVVVTYSNGEQRTSDQFRAHEVEGTCSFDVQKWRGEILRFREQTGRIPGRVTMECIESVI